MKQFFVVKENGNDLPEIVFQTNDYNQAFDFAEACAFGQIKCYVYHSESKIIRFRREPYKASDFLQKGK